MRARPRASTGAVSAVISCRSSTRCRRLRTPPKPGASFRACTSRSLSTRRGRTHCFGSPPMYSCISITVIHSSRSWLPSGAAHSAVRAMVPPIFPCGTVRARRAAQCPLSSARRLNRLIAVGTPDGGGDGSRWVELAGPPRNGHEPRALARG